MEKSNQIIFIIMLRLKQLLCEQLGGRNAVFKQVGVDRNGVVSPFDAKKIAKLIY